jgi:hypothetical protein
MAPEAMSSMMSWGARPSTVHPTLWAVPRISLMVPFNSRAIERGRITLAMLMMSSKVMLPLCLTGRMDKSVDSKVPHSS